MIKKYSEYTSSLNEAYSYKSKSSTVSDDIDSLLQSDSFFKSFYEECDIDTAKPITLMFYFNTSKSETAHLKSVEKIYSLWKEFISKNGYDKYWDTDYGTLNDGTISLNLVEPDYRR